MKHVLNDIKKPKTISITIEKYRKIMFIDNYGEETDVQRELKLKPMSGDNICRILMESCCTYNKSTDLIDVLKDNAEQIDNGSSDYLVLNQITLSNKLQRLEGNHRSNSINQFLDKENPISLPIESKVPQINVFLNSLRKEIGKKENEEVYFKDLPKKLQESFLNYKLICKIYFDLTEEQKSLIFYNHNCNRAMSKAELLRSNFGNTEVYKNFIDFADSIKSNVHPSFIKNKKAFEVTQKLLNKTKEDTLILLFARLFKINGWESKTNDKFSFDFFNEYSLKSEEEIKKELNYLCNRIYYISNFVGDINTFKGLNILTGLNYLIYSKKSKIKDKKELKTIKDNVYMEFYKWLSPVSTESGYSSDNHKYVNSTYYKFEYSQKVADAYYEAIKNLNPKLIKD